MVKFYIYHKNHQGMAIEHSSYRNFWNSIQGGLNEFNKALEPYRGRYVESLSDISDNLISHTLYLLDSCYLEFEDEQALTCFLLKWSRCG